VLLGERDVTALPPERRDIAQVFQFPVIYDTMTVHDNLAFPLRNRGVPSERVEARVRDIAAMLELDAMLDVRAAGLNADDKQKISMGRGLVREDVNVIMFDEPLTVIDPHLKWKLRSKLKELHQRVGVTMIYVTHDQTEALTFADQVMVMQEGEVVQTGTPVELFERPGHVFVGHFIGSPGMNVLPAEAKDGAAYFMGQRVETENAAPPAPEGSRSACAPNSRAFPIAACRWTSSASWTRAAGASPRRSAAPCASTSWCARASAPSPAPRMSNSIRR
jgi:glycerol transport system ATP-binding protein